MEEVSFSVGVFIFNNCLGIFYYLKGEDFCMIIVGVDIKLVDEYYVVIYDL